MKNVPQYILEFLNTQSEAKVSDFGIFTVKSSGAQLDAHKKSILPPSQFVDFKENFQIQDASILNKISADRNISKEIALHELQTQVDFWKKKYSAKEEFTIKDLGTFLRVEDELIFHGERFSADTPDFFGLEEIVFSEIQSVPEERPAPVEALSGEYRFSKHVLWLFLIILPVLLLVYFAITNQELLFGKKSFDDISVKNATHRIEDSRTVKAPLPVQDSLKVDSIQVSPLN